jgi:hypothetical protein
MNRNKLIPPHGCLSGEETTVALFESTAIINKLSSIIGTWDGSEEQAKKLVAKIELYIRNNKLLLNAIEVPTVYD